MGHRDAVASAVDYVLREDLTDFVLLGHSDGGTTISRMAEEMPERIWRLAYWNAFVLNDGESIESVSPPHYKQLMDSIAASGAHGPGAVKLPFPVWREAFMNDADLALAGNTYELTTPHPLRTLTDPVELKSFHELQIPRSYLNCTEDIAMPPGEYAWCPRFPARLGLPDYVQDSATDQGIAGSTGFSRARPPGSAGWKPARSGAPTPARARCPCSQEVGGPRAAVLPR